ncbi:ABC transporter C-terminal domain-containing protein [Traorella massiliensis]
MNQPYLSSKDKKELEGMEEVLKKLEKELQDIDDEMNETQDFIKINELSKKRSEIEAEIERKNERWIELLEIEEAISLKK